jgi:hypothetical protein
MAATRTILERGLGQALCQSFPWQSLGTLPGSLPWIATPFHLGMNVDIGQIWAEVLVPAGVENTAALISFRTYVLATLRFHQQASHQRETLTQIPAAHLHGCICSLEHEGPV